MTIILTGYMGSGKSTLGKLLAQKLDAPFLDFDQYIEAQEHTTITAIFKEKGEIYFRKQEAHYLAQLLHNQGNQNNVIALGGGTPCYGNNSQLLKESAATTIYLHLEVEALRDRLWTARDTRPLIASQPTKELLEEYIRKHLFERSYYYHQADHLLKTTGKTEDQIVHEMVALL